MNPNGKVARNFDVDENLEKLEAALTEAENILNLALSQEMKVKFRQLSKSIVGSFVCLKISRKVGVIL